ncbi:hypothetical protein GA0070563_10816 [Micromonospora carbonacea]|uniref:Uncharacterized protein n=1 Tax=Micromonospora carbonacea TaxID=47853 RepID=A0A1C4ZBZ9_9ACTN|nr:hypothetical protein GA0070563_10816 [Micromonospora carbonacea]
MARDAHRDPGSAAPAGRRARQDPRRGGAGRLGRGAAIPRTGGRSPGRRGPGGIGIAARTARIGRPRRNGIPIYRCRPRFLIRARFTSATAGPTLRRRPVAWSPPLTAKTSFVFEASRIGQERVDAIEGDAAFPRPRRTADRLHPGRTPRPGPKCRAHRSPPLARGRPAGRPPSAGTTGPSRSEILPPCGTPPDTRLRAAGRGGPPAADAPAPEHLPGRELPVPPWNRSVTEPAAERGGAAGRQRRTPARPARSATTTGTGRGATPATGREPPILRPASRGALPPGQRGSHNAFHPIVGKPRKRHQPTRERLTYHFANSPGDRPLSVPPTWPAVAEDTKPMFAYPLQPSACRPIAGLPYSHHARRSIAGGCVRTGPRIVEGAGSALVREQQPVKLIDGPPRTRDGRLYSPIREWVENCRSPISSGSMADQGRWRAP